MGFLIPLVLVSVIFTNRFSVLLRARARTLPFADVTNFKSIPYILDIQFGL